MKLQIQLTVQTAGLTYNIVFNKYLLEKMDDRASCNLKEQIIRLRRDMSNEYLFANLIHEIDHIAEDTAGIEINENETTARANLIAQAIMSMGIEPDFSLIPEENDKEIEL